MPGSVMMRVMGNVNAVWLLLVRLCREGWLSEDDDGRRNEACTHEVLHLSMSPPVPGRDMLGESGTDLARACADQGHIVIVQPRTARPFLLA
jgi:hypothetical protein